MSIETTELPAEAVEPAPPLPRRLLDTIFSPGKMARAVAADPRVLGALLVSMTLVALSTSLIPPEIMAEVQRRAALERGVEMPPMNENTLRIIRIVGTVFAGLFVGVISLVMAGLYTFVFAFILGDEGRYKQYLAVTVHAGFIPALFSLVLVPLRIQARDPQLMLSIGNFMPFLEPGYFANVFRALDLTQLWACSVSALGMRAIDPRRSWVSAFAVLAMFVLGIALIVARFLPT